MLGGHLSLWFRVKQFDFQRVLSNVVFRTAGRRATQTLLLSPLVGADGAPGHLSSGNRAALIARPILNLDIVRPLLGRWASFLTHARDGLHHLDKFDEVGGAVAALDFDLNRADL